ncbi:MAG: molybdopterin-dependent oxidoreductase [Deltaproteobacteria bacterium]|nr:molybdopterin-dependent oxidoreductase [Deltaproteobacteria bacterium]
MPKVIIDGKELEAKQGQSVLQVALENGIFIPHFCFHPQLKVAGNCRMCLVEIEKVPKLQISCGTPIRDGMVVHTDTPKVKEAREAILEFLLINHPLDCPVCDQSGECKLQDYTFEYGKKESSYREEKKTHVKKDLGEYIEMELNRCILCTRCVRYLRDVAGTEEFCLHERGPHAEVGPYLEKPLTSPFQMNLVELCPVGALTSKPFRFKARVWLMDKVRTICPGCSIGCNVVAWSYSGKLLRFTPAENPDVNRCWLCDYGRLLVDRVHSDDRLLVSMKSGERANRKDVISEIATKVKELVESKRSNMVGIIGSAHLTNEDNYAIAKLAGEVVGTENLAYMAGENKRPIEPCDKPLTEWLVSDDKTPNTRGARDMRVVPGKGMDVKAMLGAAARGEIKALLVFGDDLAASLPDEFRAAAAALDVLFVTSTWINNTTGLASLVLPEASFAEKDGTFTNEPGRVQRVRSAVPLQGEAAPAWATCKDIASMMGHDWHFGCEAEVFAEIAQVVSLYHGLSHDKIPFEGAKLGV